MRHRMPRGAWARASCATLVFMNYLRPARRGGRRLTIRQAGRRALEERNSSGGRNGGIN